MIVVRRGGELVLIRQVDHGLLSGEVARRWGNARFQRPEPLEPVVLASALHDEGWREQDEVPLFDARARAPLHWRDIDVASHVVFYAEGIGRVAARDPYAGLLVSMHGAGIYLRRYGTYQVKMTKLAGADREPIDRFVAEQEAEQVRLKRVVWTPEVRRAEFERTLWFHYELLQIWDRLSLFVCLNDPRRPAQDRLGPMPVTAAGPVLELHVRAAGDGRIELDPYPFDTPSLETVVAARAIPDRPYETADDVRAALRTARDASIHSRFVPASAR